MNMGTTSSSVQFVAAKAAEACLDGVGGMVVIDKGNDQAELYFFGEEMTPAVAILMALKGLTRIVESIIADCAAAKR